MNIISGSTVRFKGQRQILTVNGIVNGFCYIVWSDDGGKINEKSVLPESLEVVSDKEIELEKRRLNKIENAKAGLSIGDQINKIASPIVAFISILAVVYQTYRLKDLEDKIDALVNSLKNKTTQSPESLLPKRQE